MQEILSFTGASAVVTLTSSSKIALTPYHARQTTELLLHETLTFIGPDLWTLNGSDLNPANYHIMGRDVGSCVSDAKTWAETMLA